MEQTNSLQPASEQPLSKTTPLWRYVSIPALLTYLQGRVFIPSLEKLREDEPFEAEIVGSRNYFLKGIESRCGSDLDSGLDWLQENLCSDAERKGIRDSKDHQSRLELLRRRYFEFIRRTRFAWCWYKSPDESAATWSSYGNAGAAIGTTIGQLATVLDGTCHCFKYGDMDYRRYGPEGYDDEALGPPEEAATTLCFRKRLEYESENEIRFVTTAARRDRKQNGIILELLAHQWISQIRISPRLNWDQVQSIQEIVGKILPDECDDFCTRSRLAPADPYGGLLAKVGSYAGGQADNAWRNGQDEIPEWLKRL